MNLNQTKPENLRFATAPMSMEQLGEYFENRDIVFVLDYANGTLKGSVLLSYLANLEVPAEVSISRELSPEIRKGFVKDYMTHRSAVFLNGMVTTVASVLLQAKGFTEFTSSIVSPILDETEVNEFIQENFDLVARWVKLMDSMITYSISIHKTYVEAFGHPKDTVENINDPVYTGSNFVHLFGFAEFMETYYTVPGRQYYFVKQFDEYMFGGKNLFSYFVKPENPLPALVELLGSMESTEISQIQDDLLAAESHFNEGMK